jgi:hypothetical protein
VVLFVEIVRNECSLADAAYFGQLLQEPHEKLAGMRQLFFWEMETEYSPITSLWEAAALTTKR